MACGRDIIWVFCGCSSCSIWIMLEPLGGNVPTAKFLRAKYMNVGLLYYYCSIIYIDIRFKLYYCGAKAFWPGQTIGISQHPFEKELHHCLVPPPCRPRQWRPTIFVLGLQLSALLEQQLHHPLVPVQCRP